MLLANLRREYNLAGLHRRDLKTDPIPQFREWLEQATGVRRSGRVRKFFIQLYKFAFTTGTTEINASTLATVGKDGIPSARVILLKGVDARGFIFFTNYESRKGRELADNPNAALVSYWPNQERQVCIAGKVERIPSDESDNYFKTRPRNSQMGAWASHQSAVVEKRAVLEDRWKEMQAKFADNNIPRPPSWGGYVLSPVTIEFWQGRPGRFHDRFCYVRQLDKTWHLDRLSP